MGQSPKHIMNTTVMEYLLLDDRSAHDAIVDNAINASHVLIYNKRRVEPKYKSLWDFSWSDITAIRNYISNGDILNPLCIVFQFKEEKLLTALFFNCISAFKWIVEELERIGKVEELKLKNEPSQKEIDAGIEELNKYKELITLDMLTNGDPTKEEFFLSKSYREIFMRVCMHTDKNKFQQKLIDNASRNI